MTRWALASDSLWQRHHTCKIGTHYTGSCQLHCIMLNVMSGIVTVTCREKLREFPERTVLLLMSQMSKTSATLVYKELAVCVFRKN